MTDLESTTQARRLVASGRRIVVLTGAGISTDSGIPDFRGPNGVWTKNPAAEKMATLQNYLSDPEVRRNAWRVRVTSPAWTAEPNTGHRALAELEHRGNLHALITQNVDELHQRAGHDPSKVIEVHGTMRWTRCWSCDDRRPMAEAIERVDAGDEDPACVVCGGILKSDTISFGQSLTPAVIDRAMRVSEECDVFVAIGTSLQVYPVANSVQRARAAGASVIIVNGTPTKLDHLADVVVLGAIGDLLPTICRIPSADG
jgi:NAD-dependent deacetylase